MDINTLSMEQFREMPLVIEGESKEVRYAGEGLVAIKLKPTIYSFTHNRAGVVEGSDRLRLQAIKSLMPILGRSGIQHTYQDVNENWISSDLVLQPATADNPKPFRPSDLSEEKMTQLAIASPVEVVVKKVHGGTPKHRYDRFDQFKVRGSHSDLAGQEIKVNQAYPDLVVRFDWRNPMTNKAGERLADEVLPEDMADWFIDTKQARHTALKSFAALDSFFASRGLDLWDICFFITEDGQKLFGEVSPDCMRVRAANGTSLDKDIWRAGGSSSDVITKWTNLVEIIREAQDE